MAANPTNYKIADVYKNLRDEALEVGLEYKKRPNLDGVFLVLMETGHEEAAVTVLASADGSASVYFSNGGGVIGAGDESFDDYIATMKREKAHYPLHVYEFAVDPDRHVLQNPHSLHDSWFTSLTIRENRNLLRPFEPKPTIEIVLLGQMHDRDIVLEYTQVEWYETLGHKNRFNWADTFHGDIQAHEVRMEKGLIVHEIEFVSESKMVIACEDFTCTERMLS